MSDLPNAWVRAPIGSLCSLLNGRAFKPTEWQPTGLPIVRIQNLNNPAAPYNHFDGEVDERNRLRGGELLFAWSGTPGTSFGAHIWHGAHAVLNQHIFRVDFDQRLLDKRFFRFAINQKLSELIDVAHGGVGLRHVTKGVFEQTSIELPPRSEQTRIADQLDKLLARIQSCNDRLDAIPALLKRFRQAVLAAATSGALIESDNLGTSWPDTTIGAIAVDLRYGTSKKCDYSSVGTGVLRIPNIADQGRLDLGDLKRAEFDSKEISKLALREGDLLVIRSNGSVDLVGKTSLVTVAESGLLFAGYLMRLRVDPTQALPAFIQLCLSAPAQRQYIERTAKSTSGVNNLNAEELRALRLRLPSLMEQAEITRRVETLFKLADRIEARYTAACTQAQRLSPLLLAKAFRGELVPQDPNDEPASALLERIHAAKAEPSPKSRRGRQPKVAHTDS